MRLTFLHTIFFSFLLLQQTQALKAQGIVDYKKVLAEGLLPGKASVMLLSKKGFFYLATSKGLFLFNGITLQPFNAIDSAEKNITALYENKEGQLWIGCSNGSLYKLQSNKLVAWKPAEELGKKSISGFAEDEAGNIWFATKGEGLYILHQNKLYNINTDDGLSDNYVYDLQFINNQIVAATDNGISICNFVQQKKSVKNLSAANGLTDNIVQTFAPDSKNKNILWLGFQNGGVGLLNFKGQQSETIYTSPKGSPINKIFSGDKELWLATDDGLAIINSTAYTELLTEPITSLSGLYADNEANIWLLGSAALYKTKGEQLRLVLLLTDEENNQVHDLLVDANENYWITSKAGVLCFSKKAGNHFNRTYFPLRVKKNSDIICLYQDVNGIIWVGTMGDGIYLIDPLKKTIKQITDVPNLKNASILSITGTKTNVWITALEGVWKSPVSGSSGKKNYTFNNINIAQAIGSTYIYYVLEDSKNRVWFATDGKGITVLENGAFNTFKENDGVAAKVIYSVLEDRNGNIWFNTLNNGIYKYNGSTFKHFGITTGLPDLNISALALTNKESVFCSTQKENFLIDITTGRITLLGAANSTGKMNTDLNSTFSNGKNVFFHTSNGVYAYHSPEYNKVQNPQTRILSMSLFLKEQDETVANRFAHDENNLSFHFAGFYFSDPEKVNYQYKLEGYSNNWQATKDGFVNFPKLPSGGYTFKVRSSVTGNFEDADEAAYIFNIQKPFWRQWWFILLSITSVTAILFYIIKAREKEVKKMQQLQTEKLQSQYETLKNQVNPHFLFNSFNTLLSVIDEDPKKASDYVEHLSDFYRSIVNLREKDIISLGDELKIIEHYFFIQKKRFGNALHFVNPITEEQKLGFAMPPLCLQLLAENAIKHNIVSKEKPLTLSLSIHDNWLVVQNNINEKQTIEKGEGLGLQNIKNRFLLIAEKEVLIAKTHDTFIVKLPLIKLL